MVEDKIECLRLALKYAEQYSQHRNSFYNENGIIELAEKFYNFVKDEEE